jgi:integrase/recombinase XerC
VLLRYLRACRTQVLAHQHGANVFSIRDGRSAGYAPRTVNRRLAALSGLFALIEMRDAAARSPMPPRRETTIRISQGQRSGLLGHLATPSPRSGLRVREPRRLPRGLRREEVAELLASFRTVRDQAIAGLMLFSGLRSAEVRGLAVDDVDIALGWVPGKGDKERRVPADREVCGLVQSYVLSERPDSEHRALSWSPRVRRVGSR